jgi:hypothetical protein|tara:strand:- start:172 stop:345 length:174 start_codon:yes stop_codon:yes gene_type:complete
MKFPILFFGQSGKKFSKPLSQPQKKLRGDLTSYTFEYPRPHLVMQRLRCQPDGGKTE